MAVKATDGVHTGAEQGLKVFDTGILPVSTAALYWIILEVMVLCRASRSASSI
jgi:hypothetical protein